MLLLVEIGVAFAVFAIIFGFAFVSLKPEHAAGALGEARLGAAITAALIAGIVGFAVVPLRMTLIEGGEDARRAFPYAIAAFALMVLFRRGAAARLPIIGPAVRAYRMAMLRRTIAASQKQLAKLEAKSGASAAE